MKPPPSALEASVLGSEVVEFEGRQFRMQLSKERSLGSKIVSGILMPFTVATDIALAPVYLIWLALFG